MSCSNGHSTAIKLTVRYIRELGKGIEAFPSFYPKDSAPATILPTFLPTHVPTEMAVHYIFPILQAVKSTVEKMTFYPNK